MKVKYDHERNPDFAETVELCFQSGPESTKSWSKYAKVMVNMFLCITQMGFCCIYFVFISSSLKQVCVLYVVFL